MLRADRGGDGMADTDGGHGGNGGLSLAGTTANRKPAHSLAHKKRSKEPWPETRKQQGRERTSSPPRTVSTRGRRTRADRPRHPSECAYMFSRCYRYSCCPPGTFPIVSAGVQKISQVTRLLYIYIPLLLLLPCPGVGIGGVRCCILLRRQFARFWVAWPCGQSA